MKTPNRMIIAICQTRQTAGRLTRMYVFFCGPNLSQQFPMMIVMVLTLSCPISPVPRLCLALACHHFYKAICVGGGILSTTQKQGVDSLHLLRTKTLLIWCFQTGNITSRKVLREVESTTQHRQNVLLKLIIKKENVWCSHVVLFL